MLLEFFKWALGAVALGTFIGGLFYLLFSERVRRWKVSRYYSYGRYHKTREEIAEKGLKLLTLGAALMSVLYTGLSYEHSIKEFGITRRPFVRAQPVRQQGAFYRVIEGGLGPRIHFLFEATNVGSLPAYRVAFVETLKIGNVTTQSENRDEYGVLLPGDLLGIHRPFSVISLAKPPTSEEVEKFLTGKTIELELQ